MNDRLIAGGIAGFVGSIVMVLFNLLLNFIPGVSVKLLYTASNMFIPKPLLGTLEGNLMGLIVHLICGSLLGVIFVYILDFTGHRYIYLKAFGYGFITWFLLCGFVTRLLNLPVQDKFLDGLLLLLIHIPFGLTIGWIIKNFARYPLKK